MAHKGNYTPAKYEESELTTVTTHLGEQRKMLKHEGINFDVNLMNSGFIPDVRENLKKMKDMECRDDDVFICAAMKAGTHWVWEMTTMLLKGKAEYEHVSKETRMLEFHWPEEFDDLPSPRALNTHYYLRLLPEQLQNGSKGRIIFITRNPKDSVVSNFHHRRSMTIGQFKHSFSDFLQMYLDDVFTVNWFRYTNEWNEIIANNQTLQIHLMYYEDIKKDPIGETRRLADFLKVDYDEKLIKEVSHNCNFQNLKKANKEVKAAKSGNPNPEMDDFQNMYRKGEVGDWKNWFTVADNEKFDAALAEQMKGLKFEYTYSLP
ncbi:sulfotransferase 1A1-like [Ylistrum balloti]|uniref:sulfotransferase 1A1-like n=1 Tax=Ylistrum balloti TaxID=509963 RepID=UPI002905E21B|nr:sulfotransferase 1A1-like [Ylistrum balloti]